MTLVFLIWAPTFVVLTLVIAALIHIAKRDCNPKPFLAALVLLVSLAVLTAAACVFGP